MAFIYNFRLMTHLPPSLSKRHNPFRFSIPIKAFRKISYWNEINLPRMQAEADAQPLNSKKQYVLLSHLNAKGGFDDVISRVESGKFAIDDSGTKEYLKALVATDKINNLDLQNLMRSVHSFKEVPNKELERTRLTSSSSNPVPVTLSKPIIVAMQEPTFLSQVWKVIRIAVFSIIGFSALSALLEEKGLGKGVSLHSEIEPQAQKRKYKFEDVRGVDEAKEDLEEIVEFLKNPERFTRLGGKLPKGVLLIGPPGTGKTLLARAIAGEADVPFFYCSGSEFDEMFVGVGARRVRDLFNAAKKKQPCIIFIDEIDGIGGVRNPKDPNYCQMTLNQLLVEMDGFAQNEGVIVIGATNFPELLDKALIRPGRFDKHVNLPLPDIKGRIKILEAHIKDIPVSEDVDLSTLARNTHGLSGADLANIVNQAALKASVEGKREVEMYHLEYARDKILMGSERKSSVIEEANRRSVAFHESGHALVAMLTKGALPIHKATIMPRGKALGMVMQLPENDMLNWSKEQLLATLDVCMGGRVAEEFIFGKEHVSTGAHSDIEKATQVARSMVMKYGMSEKLGLVCFNEETNISSETKKVIDSEIKALCQSAYEKAKNIIKSNERQLHLIAEALLDKETLSAEELYRVVGLKNPKVKANA